MDKNILGKRVRAARGDMSLREFAKKCDISHTHVDSIEKGFDPRTGKEVSVGLETLKKISMATGLSINYLIGDTDSETGGLTYLPDGSSHQLPFSARASSPQDFQREMTEKPDETRLIIPDELQGVHVAFHRGEFEGLTQDEVDALAIVAKTMKEQRLKGGDD